jgi:hypothetical protein
MITKVNKSYGISLLEAAISLLAISFLLLLSSGLWEYILAVRTISEVVEEYSSKTYAGVFKFDHNSNSYLLDYSKIYKEFRNSYSEEALNKLKSELREQSDSAILLEFNVVSIDVDSISGQILSVPSLAQTSSIKVGQAAVPDFLLDGESYNGEADFEALIAAYIHNNSENLAIPTLGFNNPTAIDKYLAQVPLLGIRAIYKPESDSILSRLGIIDNDYIWDSKISALRGDI